MQSLQSGCQAIHNPQTSKPAVHNPNTVSASYRYALGSFAAHKAVQTDISMRAISVGLRCKQPGVCFLIQ
jgi:hypothetical protein